VPWQSFVSHSERQFEILERASRQQQTVSKSCHQRNEFLHLSGQRSFYTSLESISKFTGKPFVPPPSDEKLWGALEDGVQSIVLRQETPIEVRREIAALLNDTHDYKWTVDPCTGEVDISPEHCYNERYTQFEAQAKNADSEALSALVQLELGTFINEDAVPDEAVLNKAITEKLVSKL